MKSIAEQLIDSRARVFKLIKNVRDLEVQLEAEKFNSSQLELGIWEHNAGDLEKKFQRNHKLLSTLKVELKDYNMHTKCWRYSGDWCDNLADKFCKDV